jgi:hypothetical protein
MKPPPIGPIHRQYGPQLADLREHGIDPGFHQLGSVTGTAVPAAREAEHAHSARLAALIAARLASMTSYPATSRHPASHRLGGRQARPIGDIRFHPS